MGGPGLVNMAHYGGMMVTYGEDVNKLKKKETEECKNGEKKSENGGTPGSGSGTEGSQTPAAAEASTASVATPNDTSEGEQTSSEVSTPDAANSSKGESSQPSEVACKGAAGGFSDSLLESNGGNASDKVSTCEKGKADENCGGLWAMIGSLIGMLVTPVKWLLELVSDGKSKGSSESGMQQSTEANGEGT